MVVFFADHPLWPHRNVYFWIGGVRDSGDNWKWNGRVEGAVPQPGVWASSNLLIGVGADCMHLKHSNWYDFYCTSVTNYICDRF